ncbi:MAG TPA: hypothetical protein PK950_02685 [Candidatus Paceibacterota bacterium]|nr:hypothetical protein [Candidatus Paceibacterota bacterium]
MKKIISEISAETLSGPLKQILDNVSGADGQYWLAQLNRFLLMKPTHAFTDDMISELYVPEVWQMAKTSMEKGNNLWWKKPEWPFEIATFSYGNLSKDMIKDRLTGKLKRAQGNQYEFDTSIMMKMIDDSSVKVGRKQNVQLLKIESRFLLPNVAGDHRIDAVNVSHPKYNLQRCNEEIGFYLYLKTKGLDESLVSMPPLSVHKGKYLISWHVPTRDKYIRLSPIDVGIFSKLSRSSQWVFQFG